jgi:hypothetical protein
MIWLFVTLASLALGFLSWKSYWLPVHVLARQAETFGWVPIGTENNEADCFDMLYARGNWLVRLQRQNGALEIVTPAVEFQFKNFLEIGQWISEQERPGQPDNH